MKRRHHFVPRFYLQRFESTPRCINIYNLGRERVIEGASLRDQCHRHRLYGSAKVEDAFADLEGSIAPVLANIVGTLQAPDARTQEHHALLAFVALQLLRTPAHAARALEATTRMAHVAFAGAPPPGFTGSERQSLQIALRTFPAMVAALDDLGMHVVEAPTGHAFMTSDNPVFRYNTYCEGIKWLGVTGAVCRGLQVFLPLSPRVALMLVDGWVYKMGDSRAAASSTARPQDVESLNLIQLISAQHNVYFSTRPDDTHLRDLAAPARKLRAARVQRVQVAYQVDDDKSQLLHMHEQMPNIQLRLSFVRLRRAARRVPLLQRPSRTRKAVSMLPELPVPPHLRGRTTTFVTRRPS